MKRKFISFWTDYAEVTKVSWNWLKKHWFGYIILIIVVLAGECVWFFGIDSIRDGIKGIFSTKLNKCVKEDEEEPI